MLYASVPLLLLSFSPALPVIKVYKCEHKGCGSYTLKAKEAARLAVTFKEPTLSRQEMKHLSDVLKNRG